MAGELKPDEVAERTFRRRLRGYDRRRVQEFLDEVAAELAQLREERDELAQRVSELGDHDHRAEFEAVARDIGELLESARQAAEGLRSRAAADTARWRAEARAEADELRRIAHADAEALRGDAWSASEQLIQQCQQEGESIRANADRDALTVLGEAEREAHRLLATARRESEDTLRSAKMEGERLVVEARTRHDEIVESARKTAEAAQERARALEQRRNELLGELESVRGTIHRLESDLEERQEALAVHTFPSSGVGVRVLSPEESEEAGEEPAPAEGGEPGGEEGGEEPVLDLTATESPAEEVAAEPSRDEAAAAPRQEPIPEPFREGAVRVVHPPPRQEPDWSAEPVRVLPPEEGAASTPAKALSGAEQAAATGEGTAPGGPGDDVSQLFASLRTPPATAPPAPAPAAPPRLPPPELGASEEAGAAAAGFPVDEPDLFGGPLVKVLPAEPEAPPEVEEEHPEVAEESAAAEEEVPAVEEEPPAVEERPLRRGATRRRGPVDPHELRDRLLLPVANRIMRSVKRQLTEDQNIALEELRLSEAQWKPDPVGLEERLHGDLAILAQESFAAGWVAAEEMTGVPAGRPRPEKSDVPNHAPEIAAAVTEAVRKAVAESVDAGDSPQQTAATLSRVYRLWRTDEGEQRMFHLSAAAYHRGLSRALGRAGVTGVRWVVSGRGCADCRAAQEAGPVVIGASFPGAGEVPPAHAGCGCSLLPA